VRKGETVLLIMTNTFFFASNFHELKYGLKFDALFRSQSTPNTWALKKLSSLKQNVLLEATNNNSNLYVQKSHYYFGLNQIKPKLKQ
jgi:hypothetical protein